MSFSLSSSSSYKLSRKEGFVAVGSWWQIGGPVGGLGLVKTRGVKFGTGEVMVKAVEVAWLEPVVRSGGGKAGTGGVDFGYGEREKGGWKRKREKGS